MNNNVTLEQIDKVLERFPNISYAEAKEALIIADGDIIDAIIYLEQMKKSSKLKIKAKAEEVLGKDTEQIKDQLKEMLKKSNVIRIVIEKEDRTIMNIPITIGVIGLALGPLVTLVGLSAAVLGKFNIKIENEEDKTVIDLGELTEEKINILKNMLTNTAKEVGEAVKKEKNDNKDITEELIQEEENKDIPKF
ncbi:MAG: DUF4342 domain-containing protein [Peptostreptococcaceae bacterium]|jgi:hypothetical protein|nr:DUF4342 domain-containing protein [Peptostreptococcaceae bacterium]MBQ1793211.1 DUF4342 domain-containing protein [Peptostreptococcaceae bacterium]